MWNRFNGRTAPFGDLVGKTLVSVVRGSDESRFYGDFIEFITSDGEVFAMYYSPDCCASCYIEDVCGDLQDLVGTPVLMADLETNRGDDTHGGSETWSFYKLATVKGSVTIRWYGSSNGYYSEEASFEREVP